MTYIALLRGINVGGKNVIAMADLRACLVDGGFCDVQTYIQSGNVLFTSKQAKTEVLEQQIETLLQQRFAYTGMVVVVSATELAKVVTEAPTGFGSKPEVYRYDVLFVKRPLPKAAAAKDIPTHPEVDALHVGQHALYFSRCIADASKSRLSKITTLPVYQRLTIRNWNTTTKLLALATSAT